MNRLPRTRFQNVLYLLLALTLLALTVALGWMNYRFAAQSPGGNDFLVHWEGTRALLFKSISPYSDETALLIQQRAYGRPAQPGEHELRVAYPLYSALVFAPFALIGEYTLARAVWMTALELALIALAVLSLRLTRWRPAPWLLGVYLLFVLTWYHGVRPVINGNAVVLVALFIAGSLLALSAGQNEAAGILLALATIKPHLVLLPAMLMLIWTVSQRRWRFVVWFLGMLVFLIALGMFFIPNWPLQNLREILRYTSYNPPTTIQDALQEWLPGAGRQLGWILSAGLGILLLVEWARAWKKPFHHFLWVLCLTLTAGQWIGMTTDPGNFILLFLPLTLVFAEFEHRYGHAARWWSLFSILGLLVGLWWIFLVTLTQVNGQPQQSTVMFVPLPLYLFWGLYWVRWWAIHTARLPDVAF
ncbi:MAG: hypothetical protein Fur0018_12750 [Anaerolineales bacterium]